MALAKLGHIGPEKLGAADWIAEPQAAPTTLIDPGTIVPVPAKTGEWVEERVAVAI
jgi:hypothetical protein